MSVRPAIISNRSENITKDWRLLREVARFRHSLEGGAPILPILGGGHSDSTNVWKVGNLYFAKYELLKTEIAQIRQYNTNKGVIKTIRCIYVTVLPRFCQSLEGGAQILPILGGGTQLLPDYLNVNLNS